MRRSCRGSPTGIRPPSACWWTAMRTACSASPSACWATGRPRRTWCRTPISLWRKAGDWTPQARVSTWLYRVARNAALDRLRRLKPTVDPDDVTLIDSGPAPDRRLHDEATAGKVRAALDALPERQRAAIVLVHYEGLSGADASAALDISVEALESLLARGRRSLRQALEGQRAELLGETR